MLSVSNHSCCGCNPDPCSNCPPRCKPITSADLATLIYIKGLDVNYCPKYQAIADALGLVDCNGDPIVPGQPIVTCAQMQEQLCEIFAAFVNGGEIVPGTVLIGANCQKYTMPEFQAPLEVTDTSCIDLEIIDGILTATPIVSPNPTNVLGCFDGLYVPSACEQLGNIPVPSIPATDSTVLITRNCVAVDLTNYQENITAQDTSCINLNLTGGVLTATPIISPVAGNQISCTNEGLFAPEPDAAITVTGSDTNTVDVIVTPGVNTYNVSAEVIISGDAGNVLEEQTDGLYVPSVCEQFLDIVQVPQPATPSTIFVDRSCNLVTLPASQAISVDDTVTIDLSLIGGEITGDVNISSVAGNQIQTFGDGLYVAASVTDVNITGTNTNCIGVNVIEGPANAFSISANPIISPAAGNQISCTANGFFVPATANPVTCEAIQGLFPSSGDNIVSGDEILVGPDCETKTFPQFIGLTNSCASTAVTVDGNDNINIETTIDVASIHPSYTCNGLVCAAGGLSAPPDVDGLTLTTPILPDSYNGATVAGQVIVIPPVTLQVTNPSNCRQAVLMLGIRVPEIEESQTGVVPNRLEIDLEHSFSFPSQTLPIQPVTSWAIQHMSATDVVGTRTAAGMIINAFVMQPGETGTYTGYLTITQAVGSLTNLRVDPVVLRAFLYTI